MLLDQVMHFDFDHSKQWFEKTIVKRANLMKKDLERKDKADAVSTWLFSPFYVVAWNVMWDHLDKITKKEDNAICDEADIMSDNGLSADDTNCLIEIDGPARTIGKKDSYQHIYQFIDYLINNKSHVADQILAYRKRVVTPYDWRMVHRQEYKDKIRQRKAKAWAKYNAKHPMPKPNLSDDDLPF